MVLYRTIFYFPNIVSLTVVGIIWSFVFHPNVGIVNKILGAVGLESLQRSWLGDSKTALWCIAFTLLWQAAGYYMVMHIAAMDAFRRKSMSPQRWTVPAHGASSSVLRCL